MKIERRFFVYYADDGVIRFKSDLPKGQEPPAVDGLGILEVGEGVCTDGRRVLGGELVEDDAPASAQLLEATARSRRNEELRQSDWTQGRDTPLDELQVAAWAAHRQKLRDLTDDPAWPNVDWPVPPGA
jgi:hypothetical protein